MTLINLPFDPRLLPRFADISPDQILPAIDAAIAEHQAVVADIVARRPSKFPEIWMPIERVANLIDAVWWTVSHLNGVADSPELRAAHAEAQRRLIDNEMEFGQNRDLYDLLVGLTKSSGFADLHQADQVVVKRTIRDFTMAGVALAPDQRRRFREISVELSELSTAFGSAVLDATDAWDEMIDDEHLLAGVSDTDKAMFRDAARAKGVDGWRVTLQQPSVAAILTFAENRDLRARLYRANVTRASDQGPCAGQFDNTPRISRLIDLRREAAILLGFSNPVEQSLATKMAPNSSEVLAFLRDLAERARPAAERDLADLQTFAMEVLGYDDLQPWDVAFASDRLRQRLHAIDEQEIRTYFPVDRVLKGWKNLLGQLFGIRLVDRDNVAVYHPDVRYFDVADDDGTVIAGVYLDLYARPGKRNGAWMSAARARLDDGDAQTLPVAYLVCNFAPSSEAVPSLLSHYDVTTLLHETGHCLHHLFTRVDRPSIAGINGFEWDAIELPSQLMEDFAWDRGVLTGMSGHFRSGAPLPETLFDRLLNARHFQAGMAIVRQVEYSLFDLLLHLGTLGSDPREVIDAVRDEVAVIRPPEWNRFPNAFTHIFTGGYASGYYSYLWAELLAADGFMAFAEAGLVDRATGDRFRAEVLSRGATRPAADGFRAFRGRDADPKAMLVRHGLAETLPG